MVDIGTALTSISTALGIAKTLNEINKDFDASVFKIQIADLRSSLADAKVALSDVQQELADKDTRIAGLLKNFELSGTLVENGSGFRCFVDDNGQPKGYAVCPRCETVDGRLIRFVQAQADRGHAAMCPQCKQMYDSREAHA